MISAVHSRRGQVTCLEPSRVVPAGNCSRRHLIGWPLSLPMTAMLRHDGARRPVLWSCTSADASSTQRARSCLPRFCIRSACSCWCRRRRPHDAGSAGLHIFGPALPEPFVQFELAAQLAKLGVLVKIHGKDFERDWGALRRQLRSTGGPQSVCNHVVAPLAECLGFDHPARQDDVATREGMEDGGWLMQAPCGSRLRAWPSRPAWTSMRRIGPGVRIGSVRCAVRNACCWPVANGSGC